MNSNEDKSNSLTYYSYKIQLKTIQSNIGQELSVYLKETEDIQNQIFELKNIPSKQLLYNLKISIIIYVLPNLHLYLIYLKYRRVINYIKFKVILFLNTFQKLFIDNWNLSKI